MFSEMLGYTQIEYYRRLIPAMREERIILRRIREIASPAAVGARAADIPVLICEKTVS
jgi:hypothetical protein